MITDITARIAGYFLYVNRGLIDPEDTAQNQVKPSYDYAEQQIDEILSGRLKLDATRAADTTYPTVPEES